MSIKFFSPPELLGGDKYEYSLFLWVLESQRLPYFINDAARNTIVKKKTKKKKQQLTTRLAVRCTRYTSSVEISNAMGWWSILSVTQENTYDQRVLL